MIEHPAPPSDLSLLEHAEVAALGAPLEQLREAPVTKAFGKVAELGDQEPLYAAAAGLTLLGLVLRDRRLIRVGLRIGAAVAVSDAMKSAIKKLVARTRPHDLAEGSSYMSKLGGVEDKAHQSFPSGHVAATLAAARALARVYPSTGPAGAAVVIGLGATRVAQGAHWPTDVAAGAVVGGVSELVTETLLHRFERATRIA